MKFVFLALFALAAPIVRAQTDPLANLPPLPPVRDKVVTDPDGLVHVSAKADWKAWLGKHFPDASARWTAEAAKAFESNLEGPWDFVGKADYDGDGVPTALLLRFKRSPKRSEEVLSRVRVMKWTGSGWTTPLELNSAFGVRMNGAAVKPLAAAKGKGFILDFGRADPKNKRSPGMWIYMELANGRDVAMTESVQFYYLATEKKYAVDD